MRYSIAFIAICFAFLASGTAALAQDAMARCASLTDDRARLACYDSAAPQTRAAPLPANPPALARPRPAPKKQGWFSGLFGGGTKKTPDQYGSEDLSSAPRPSANVRLSARVASYTFAPITHFFTISLDNGQVWRQDEGDTTDAKLIHKPNTYIVSIVPGFFGSYNMTIRGIGGSFKVHRVR